MTKYQKYKLIILSVFCFFLLLTLWSYSKILRDYSLNGRYILREESFVILDTKTGTIYFPNSKIELEEFSKSNKKDKK